MSVFSSNMSVFSSKMSVFPSKIRFMIAFAVMHDFKDIRKYEIVTIFIISFVILLQYR